METRGICADLGAIHRELVLQVEAGQKLGDMVDAEGPAMGGIATLFKNVFAAIGAAGDQLDSLERGLRATREAGRPEKEV